jgi:hypothetical protein
MKRLPVALIFFALVSVTAFASKDDGEFPLVIHITAVQMEQGQTGVSGSGSTDSNGNYSSSVSGGESYTWKLYTANIEGDPRVYGLSTPRMHYKGGTGLAVATLGWSEVATARRNYWLNIGNYHGRWNKDGSLEIQFHANGKLMHQTFHVETERVSQNTLPPSPPSVTPPAPISNSVPPSLPAVSTPGMTANLYVESSVPGGDIEIDGSFVGNTPSTIVVALGNHQIVVKKKGFKDWSRTLNVTGGTVHLSAELEHQ